MLGHKLVVTGATLGAGLWLQGCGGGGAPSPTPAPTAPTGPTTTTHAPTTSTTSTESLAENIWQFRSDMTYAAQTTDDMSGDIPAKSLYGGCYQNPYGLKTEDLAASGDVGQLPLDEQCKENNQSFCEFKGTAGVTLLNKRKTPSKPGCLMRKTRLPIDLSEIGKMELDVTTSSSNGKAPWFAVWLVPMIYPAKAAAENAAEIDLLENFQFPTSEQGTDVNKVNTQFSTCGLNQPQYSYTLPYCKIFNWGAVADKLNHHITLKATPEEGRTLEVHRCDVGSTTCDSQQSKIAYIKVGKEAPAGHTDWFPVWDKQKAGEWYGKYWLVADIWYTSNTDFRLSLENIKFHYNNGSEWKMPLGGPPPLTSAPTPGPTPTPPGPSPTPGGKACSAHAACAGLKGNCCPTDHGDMLLCCHASLTESIAV